MDQLVHQRRVKVDFHIWNNNVSIRREVDRLVAPFRSRLNVTVRHSPSNVGCLGRFVHAKEVGTRYPFVVVIDDDQLFDEYFIRQLWDEKNVGGVSCCYAFRFVRDDDYWTRTLPDPGDPVEYCGPGGMILDSRLLAEPELLQGPRGQWMMDDLWLSYMFHHRLRVPMTKCSAPVSMTDRANDTWHTIRGEKSQFLADLRRLGWQV